MNAISYVRFSSVGQADGASLARQTEATAAYCERMGLALDDTLCLRDLGVSAWSGANVETGALGALLKLVQEGRIERGTRLIVENLDRLSRQAPLDSFETVRRLLKAGLVIVTLMDGQEYTAASVNGGQVFVLLGHLQRAHSESQVKSDRCRDAWRRKRRAAVEDRKPMTATCPSWLRLAPDRSKYVPVANRVAIVKRILQLAIDGVGITEMAKRFNREGLSTLTGRGVWWPAQISNIITQRALIGEYQPTDSEGKPCGDPIGGYFPAVVDKATYYAAVLAFEARSKKRGRYGRRINLFAGLITDLKGSTWTMRGAIKPQPFLTSSAGKAGVPGHVQSSVALVPLETGLCRMIGGLWERRPVGDRQQIDTLLGEVADAEARLSAVRDAIAGADPQTVTTLVAMVPDLERKRNHLQADADRPQAEAGRRGPTLPSLIDELEASPEDQEVRLRVRQAIREYVQGVRFINVEHVKRGEMGKGQPAGTWVTVEVTMVSGAIAVAGLTWALGVKHHDVAVVPLVGGLPPAILEGAEVLATGPNNALVRGRGLVVVAGCR